MSTTIAKINEAVLDKKLSDLESARQWSPRVISKLETLIRSGDDYDLFRINALQFATEKGIAETESIDLFLNATKLGLFEMEWNLICRSCGHIIDNFRDLSHVHAHAICGVCRATFDAALDDYLQVTFTIVPQIRDLVYRHPERLTVEDFYLKYHLVKGVKASGNGAAFPDVLRNLTRILTYLEPSEKTSADIDVIPGVLAGSDIINKTSITLVTGSNANPTPQTVSLTMQSGKFQVPGKQLASAVLPVYDSVITADQYEEINPGKLRVEIENLMDKRCAIWMMNLPMTGGQAANFLQFDPFLSGKRLLTTQTFRDLFRSEVVQSTEGLAIKDITFLFTDLKGSTAMYEKVGDPNAYFLVRQHFDTLGRAITQKSGAVVKTIGDAVMATFENAADAVDAALTMIEGIDALNQNVSQPLSLKIGIHRGHSIAVTLNERLDYFGQTVNIASRIQGLADANEIYVSKDVFDAPGVSETLKAHHVASEHASLKGISEKLQVYKIIVRK